MSENQNGCLDTLLYNPELLQQLDPSKFKGQYKDGITPLKPGESLIIRPLCLDDFDKGYLKLLEQLTSVGDVSKKDFEARFNSMRECKDTYFITVIEDTSTGQVVGSASLITEQKFIHKATQRGRVEDVVVSDAYRGKQLGKVLVDVLVNMSEYLGCYKTSLECKDDKVKFYEPFGFTATTGQNFMQQRLFD